MKKLHDLKLQAINIKKDFTTSFYSTFGMTEAASDNVGDNQYYFNETTGIASIKNLGSKSNYIRLFFPNLSRGDIIELEFEGMNISSPSGIQVQIQETTARGSVSLGAVHTLWTHKEQDSAWTKEKYTFVNQIQYNKNVYVCVGLFTTDASPNYIRLRNIKARVMSATGIGSAKTIQDIKVGEIVKNSSGWSRRTDFAGDNFTISETDTSTLRVTYSTPFKILRPLVNAIQEYFSSSHKYTVRVNSQIDYFELKFYDSSGIVVPLASITNDTFVGFIAIGEKNYFDE